MLKPATTLLLLSSLVAALPAHGSTAGDKLCAGRGHGCHRTIQAAVDAAHDGDTIVIGPGRFAGGITIDKSVRLIGAGARQTIIKGGGPVVTIGEFLAPEQPTVAISAVTITGGLTTSSPQSEDFGEEGVVAFGGGIEISPSANFGVGATVTITDSAVTGNRVGPTATVPSGVATCPGGESCPFAWAKGGGIDSWGRLTLTDTTVSGNRAAGIASDADGGGISVWDAGTLTLVNSDVMDNRAVVSEPNGRFAEGGGIFTDAGVPLSVRGGVVSGNEARLTSRLPYFVEGADPIDMNANGGGIHSGEGSDATIDGVSIRRNAVSVRDPNGEPYAYSSGLETVQGPGGVVELRDSRIEENRIFAAVGSSEHAGPSGDAMDIDGPVSVSHTVLSGNEVLVTSHEGSAAATGTVYVGGGSEAALITNSVIAGNTSRAVSAAGEATVQGAGLVNDGQLHLRDVLVAGNLGRATGTGGFARGGGIWNGRLFNEQGPIELALESTLVTRNRLSASAGVEVEGGGIFTDFPVTLDASRIVKNSPDQCSGC